MLRHEIPMPARRERITGERDRSGHYRTADYPDSEWIGYRNQGGGHVPADYFWPTNPRQLQEEQSSG